MQIIAVQGQCNRIFLCRSSTTDYFSTRTVKQIISLQRQQTVRLEAVEQITLMGTVKQINFLLNICNNTFAAPYIGTKTDYISAGQCNRSFICKKRSFILRNNLTVGS